MHTLSMPDHLHQRSPENTELLPGPWASRPHHLTYIGKQTFSLRDRSWTLDPCMLQEEATLKGSLSSHFTPSRILMETPSKHTAVLFSPEKAVLICSPPHPGGNLPQRFGIWGGSDFADFRQFTYEPWNALWMGPKPRQKIHFWVI